MPREDLVQLEGQVSDATGGGNYRVTLDNGVTILAKLCGQMKRFKIRVIVGDRVTVGVSPYDLSHGLIVHRHNPGSPGASPPQTR
ncbi:MAG: translation initiation factor IF-1 [Deltaproteobacteria bacterium]|nr:translation initiation factor IF-1 [Deltaproteobacteria bacterium]